MSGIELTHHLMPAPHSRSSILTLLSHRTCCTLPFFLQKRQCHQHPGCAQHTHATSLPLHLMLLPWRTPHLACPHRKGNVTNTQAVLNTLMSGIELISPPKNQPTIVATVLQATARMRILGEEIRWVEGRKVLECGRGRGMGAG